MDKEEFLKCYWKNYILLEKEFIETLNYITLDTDNYDVYSAKYIKILLQIGSEVDIDAKLLCEQYGVNNAETIDNYRNVITSNDVNFCDTKVEITQYYNVPPFMPWETWKKGFNPDWWKAYNKVKHERLKKGEIENVKKEYYKFANLKYTLHALGGLYQLLIYIYFKLADEIKTPIPGSRIFQLSGNGWDKISFYHDVAFVINKKTGHLEYKSGIY